MAVLFLLVISAIWSTPVLIVLLFARHRVNPWVARATMAVTFAAPCGYMLYRMEWFDVWRHGIPPVSYFVTAYVPYIGAFAALGWLLAAWVVPRSRLARRSFPELEC